METVLFCEREPFCQQVLRKHWPGVPIIDDVLNVTRKELDRIGIGAIDIVSAGFPCQPFSHAGKREGTEDERYLWPEVVRILADIRPRWFVGENVTGLLSMAQPDRELEVVSQTVARTPEEDFYEAVYTQQEDMLINDICQDLENIGYKVQVFSIPAAAVRASHRRDRVFIVGYTKHAGPYGASVRRSVDSTSNYDTEGQNETSQSAGASRREGYAPLADSASEGLQKWGQSRFAKAKAEDGAGMESESERCSKTVADADGKSGLEAYSPARSFGGKRESRNNVGRGGWSPRTAENRGPTQPGMGGSFAEFPERMDRGGLDGQKESTGSNQILRTMREETGEKAIQSSLGRHENLQTKEILQLEMCGSCESERKCRNVRAKKTSYEVQERQMRDMRDQQKSSSPSYRRELTERRTDQHHDVMRIMPYQMALGEWEGHSQKDQLKLVKNWLDGCGINPLDKLTELIAQYPQPALMGMPQHEWEPPRVATGVKNRVGRLKALGNAVDPLQVFPILYAIKLIDRFISKKDQRGG